MTTYTHNDPAFPIVMSPGSPDQMSWAGVTKLEFFACNAPCQIPDWFIHVPPVKNISKRYTLDDISDEEDRKTVKDWQYDPIYDLPDHLQWYSDKLKQMWDEEAEYEKKNIAARYFQWRRFYAEQLLSQLEKQ